ncbi:protein SMG9 isoform X1 [Amborella trichopoda]|nr:protein SMG9 isoform X1 [Amborella trichopoda]|eukprot:XP_011626940.1 protein SMG9 isoform X1 [Amborella trichopoda]
MGTASGASTGVSGPSSSSSSAAPKIILAKPPNLGATVNPTTAKFIRSEDESVARPRPSLGSFTFVSESWDVFTDRLLPFMSDNTDFTVIGIIGPPGVGKSTILNELYGFDGGTTGMLPPFPIQSEETRAMAKHCSVGIELRISAERLILLDTQPVFSPSVLAEIMRPDGSSAISILNGEPLSAELAHEMMGIQLGVFLASVCHILLVVSEGVHDYSMWQLMGKVDVLKQGIPDPSLVSLGPNLAPYKDRDALLDNLGDFMADPVFVHSKLQDREFAASSVMWLRKTMSLYFQSSSFWKRRSDQMEIYGESKHGAKPVVLDNQNGSLERGSNEIESADSGILGTHFFVLPLKIQDDSQKAQLESYGSMLAQLRDQVLSMPCHSFAKTIAERDWLRNSAKIWEIVKKSPVIADYCRTLQSSGLYRR